MIEIDMYMSKKLRKNYKQIKVKEEHENIPIVISKIFCYFFQCIIWKWVGWHPAHLRIEVTPA